MATQSIRNLTKDQALAISAEQGRKIRHEYFSDDEWIKIRTDGRVETEEGYLFTPDEFWKHRQDFIWNTGWDVIDESAY